MEAANLPHNVQLLLAIRRCQIRAIDSHLSAIVRLTEKLRDQAHASGDAALLAYVARELDAQDTTLAKALIEIRHETLDLGALPETPADLESAIRGCIRRGTFATAPQTLEVAR